MTKATTNIHKFFLSSRSCPGSLSAPRLRASFDKLARQGTPPELLFMLKAHVLGCWAPLLTHDRKMARWLVRQKRRPILALAVTEAESGSDVYSMKTTAQRRGKCWVLSGIKTFVTNAPIATHILILAKTERTFSCFLIPRSAHGVRIRALKPLIGLTRISIGEVILDSVKLPDELLIGGLGQGADIFRTAMLWERSLMFSDTSSVLIALCEQVEARARTKIRGGSPLVELASFRETLSSVRQSAETIRAVVVEAAAALDGQGNPIRASLRAKLVGAGLYEKSSRLLLQLGGAEACFQNSPLEENFRNSILSSLYSGPNKLLETLLEAIN